MGPSIAAAIVAYRSRHGRFSSADELQEVRGIGPAKWESLQPLVHAGR
ncbi:MAG: helix-hairpin-helix domain-containing protein [Microthrixaceae bacterium]